MQFEYENSADEFVASQLLYLKLSRGDRRIRLRENPLIWIAVGAFFFVIAWNERAINWAPILLTFIGCWWIYSGLVSLFPARYFRRQYSKMEFWGKRFKAEVNESGFGVEGELCAWRIPWQGVKVKGEHEIVFMFYSANTVFAFGKRFLSAEEQEELRRLSGLSAK
jgi:hypothetical protein